MFIWLKVRWLSKRLLSRDRQVRQNAAAMLGDLGDPRAVEPLIKALGDYNNGVREAATEALPKFGEHAVRPLIEALWDANKDVRRAATEALVRLGDPRATEPLIKLLGDKDNRIRKAAINALVRLGAAPSNP